MEQLDFIIEFLNKNIFHLGSVHFSLGLLIYLIFGILCILIFSNYLKKFIVQKVLANRDFDYGTRDAIGTIAKYMVIIIGFSIVLQTSGINLSALGFIAGALGIGIGFGLQNITSNFISGLIILFERPVKVGDRVEIGGVRGDIVKISARSTTVVTNDNIAYIVPNSKFIEGEVINWSFTDTKVRLGFDVGVSYKEDPEIVREILLKIASKNEDVLENPPPMVIFDKFGDSSLNFKLLVWTTEFINRPAVLKSILYFEIFKQFKLKGIEIPFPQRDLHLKSSEIDFGKNSKNTENENLSN
jgi:small-conductance mechanosensitive channel